MTDPELLSNLGEQPIVALTLYGEARGEPVEGRVAVGNVIRNRVASRGFGTGYRAVCLAPAQFSCWQMTGGLKNYQTLLDAARQLQRPGQAVGPVLRECLWIASGIVGGQIATDETHGATHYLTAALYQLDPPSWARGQKVLARIGSHVFLRPQSVRAA